MREDQDYSNGDVIVEMGKARRCVVNDDSVALRAIPSRERPNRITDHITDHITTDLGEIVSQRKPRKSLTYKAL